MIDRIQEEGDRQATLLALGRLAAERPGWDYMLGLIADQLGGRAMYTTFQDLARAERGELAMDDQYRGVGTVIMSCDHHGEGGGIPSTRSRQRMLEQLRAAQLLANCLIAATRGSVLHLDAHPTGPVRPPTIELPLTPFMEAWTAFRSWRMVAPQGSDWDPPLPTPEIRVPPDVSSSETAAPEGVSQAAKQPTASTGGDVSGVTG